MIMGYLYIMERRGGKEHFLLYRSGRGTYFVLARTDLNSTPIETQAVMCDMTAIRPDRVNSRRFANDADLRQVMQTWQDIQTPLALWVAGLEEHPEFGRLRRTFEEISASTGSPIPAVSVDRVTTPASV